MRTIVIGTRKSKLALIQTNWVIDQLEKKDVRYPFEVKEFFTKGDRNLKVSIDKVGGSGIFIEEIEQAIMDGVIDVAVHSLKDVPANLPDGLVISSIPVREDARDAYIAKDHVKLRDLPSGAVVGTSSLRRSAQILAERPDIKTTWIRGTVGSRIQQLHGNKFDAIILAVAGIKRLGISMDIITEYLPAETFVPAVGQGALAIECREDDKVVRDILARINDEATSKSVETERLCVNLLDDTDKAPIGSYAYMKNDEVFLHVVVASKDGSVLLRAAGSGDVPEDIAKRVADDLIQQGAKEVIESFKAEIKKEE